MFANKGILGFVAQLVEHLPFKQGVPGSSPGGPTMFVLYILYDENRDKFYIGQTGNLKDRLQRHFNKHSKCTKSGSWKLVYTETFSTRSQACQRERYLKSLKDKQLIKKLVSRASRF